MESVNENIWHGLTAWRRRAEIAETALVRIRAHTSFVNPSVELLSGLLQNIERIVEDALKETNRGSDPHQSG